MWVCQGFVQWQHKALRFVLRAPSDDAYCFLVPELILGGPISWFFSMLWNDHWALPCGSHPLNSFLSIKGLFLQHPITALWWSLVRNLPKVFLRNQMYDVHWIPCIILQTPALNWGTNSPHRCHADPFPTGCLDFCIVICYWLYCHAKAGSGLALCASQKPCLTLFCRQITLTPHHSCSTGDPSWGTFDTYQLGLCNFTVSSVLPGKCHPVLVTC